MHNAIDYAGMYYLLLDEFPDRKSLIQDLREKKLPAQHHTIALCAQSSVVKERSKAPRSLSGYLDKPRVILLDNPSDVYTAQDSGSDQSCVPGLLTLQTPFQPGI